MELARVRGSVVATRRSDDLQGVKLLIIEPVDEKLEPKGTYEVAVDAVQAGPGDLVYWVMGREGAMALAKFFVLVDAGIVGIVDEVDV
ncbi:MAG: EutN/CcmL family microcompartment protein [Proteobacteria bacterium]|nr:EutN/CcmL family microcompartment protein [Pseudomonadota bacterium]MBU1742395.1 EutN/CcmL family microcompartment protein [Pseudomonadota bacterium]